MSSLSVYCLLCYSAYWLYFTLIACEFQAIPLNMALQITIFARKVPYILMCRHSRTWNFCHVGSLFDRPLYFRTLSCTDEFAKTYFCLLLKAPVSCTNGEGDNDNGPRMV